MIVELKKAGVTSWGIGCASAENPGEWAKVSNYIDWIEERLESGKIKNELKVTSPPKESPQIKR